MVAYWDEHPPAHEALWGYLQAKGCRRKDAPPIAQKPRDPEANDASMAMLMTMFPVTRIKK